MSHIKKYSDVYILSNLFYDKEGKLDTELVLQIFNSSKLSIGQFLKKQISILKKKSITSKDKRLHYILSNLERSDFRKTWYKNIEKQKASKQADNFHNLVYKYLCKQYPFLNFNPSDSKDYFWSVNGRIFLLAGGIKEILSICNTNGLQKKHTALFLWAFLDAHVWNAVGFSHAKPFYETPDLLFDTLNEAEEHEIISYLSPPKPSVLNGTKLTTSSNTPKEEKPASSPGANELTSKSEELKQLDKLAKTFFDLKNDLRSHLDSNELDEISEKTNKLNEIKILYEEKLEALRTSFNKRYSTQIIKSPPNAVLVSSEQEYRYLRKIEKTISKVSLTISKEIEHDKKLLQKKFEKLKKQVPDEIKDIHTRQQLNEFKNRWEPVLVLEETYISCIKDGLDESNIDELNYKDKFAIFKQLSETRGIDFPDYNSLLERIISDPDLLTNPAHSQKLILPLLKNYLKKGIDLPKKIWASIKMANKGDLISVIEDERIFSLIEGEEGIDLEGLMVEFDGSHSHLPESLRISFDLHAIKLLNPDDQIKSLSDLMIDSNQREKVAQALLKVLYKEKMYNEAFYLASLCSRMRWINLSDSDLNDLVFIILCKNVQLNINNMLMVKEIFEDNHSNIKKPEDIVLLLYFCSLGNQLDDIHINIQYQEPDLYSQSLEQYPVICKFLIDKIKERELSGTPENQDFDSLLYKGYNALRDFNNNIKRRSCFVNWPEATRYQEYFVAELKKEFSNIETKKDSYFEFNAEGIIEKAQKDLGLLPVNNKIKIKMTHYLKQQFENLRLIKQTLNYIPLEDLYSTERNIKEKFENESSLITNRALKYLYSRLKEEF